MRALGRFRFVATAAGIPLCIAALGVGLDAAAFDRPSASVSLAAGALRELAGLHAMRGSEISARRSVSSICVQGDFRHDGRITGGALVLLGDGTRLYDFGHGVRNYDGRLPTPVQRRRFQLAGCPLLLGDRLGSRLMKGVTAARPTRADGGWAYGVRVGRSSALELFVTRRTLRPLALRLPGAGWSDLEPGADRVAIAEVRRAFGLARPEGRRRA